jgi:hypothetical protein
MIVDLDAGPRHMGWALAWFGLPHDADEQALKRAYAKRLKTARPDEDPAAFQELRSHYDAALEWCRMDTGLRTALIAAAADMDGDAAFEEREAATEAVETPSAQPESHGDFEDLYEAFLDAAQDGTPETLRAWLEADERLWSLEHKRAFGEWLLETLDEREPPIGGPMFDVVLDFFHPDRTELGWLAASRAELRDRLELAWGVDPSNDDLVPRAFAQLTRPFDLRQVLVASLLPFKPRRAREALQDAQGIHRAFAGKIVPEQARWWERAGDARRFSWPRTFTALTRIAAFTLVAWLWLLLGNDAPGAASAEFFADLSTTARTCAWLVAGWIAWCCATTAGAWVSTRMARLPQRWRLGLFLAWLAFMLARLYLAALR